MTVRADIICKFCACLPTDAAAAASCTGVGAPVNDQGAVAYDDSMMPYDY